jgi:NADPH:quinone reductase-like Zn-dependent oxidoreductase
MKAYIVDAYGKGRALRLGDMPEPVVGDHDLLVEIHASSLNPLDSKVREGAFKPFLPYRPPFVLGHDMAGTVIRVGAKVTRFKVGDAVYGRPRDGRIGTFAEAIAIHEADVALKPTNLSMEEAASLPLVGLTAWQALVEQARLQKGQKVLIHAGAGGVGTFAIQLARHLGARVATTTSTANVDLVRSLGADDVIDYRTQRFDTLLSGYDVVLNSLDGDTLVRSLAVLKPGGKLISISGPPDPAFAHRQGLNIVLRQVMRFLSFGIRRKARARDVDYSFLFMRADGGQLGAISSLVEAGAVRPIIDRVFPFERLNDAFTHIDTGRAKGKVVLTRSTAKAS